jgi:hypothetical protein
MSEWRLFEDGTVPECTTADWYAGRERAPHLEEESHRPRLLRSSSLAAQLAMNHNLRTLVDLGAGDGGLLSLLGPAMRGWGYDLAPANVEAAKGRGVDVRQGDVVEGEIDWGSDCGRDGDARAPRRPARVRPPHRGARRGARVLVPVHESNVSHYEFHTWAWDFDGYRALVEQAGLEVKVHDAVGPFQVIMAVKP